MYNLRYIEGSSKIDVPTYTQIKQSKELKFLSHPFDAASYLVDFIGRLFYKKHYLERKLFNMETLLYYSPVIIVVLVFLIQQRIVVTPEQLERKHREILTDVENRFVTINSYKDLKSQFTEIKDKIDKIYDCLIISK